MFSQSLHLENSKIVFYLPHKYSVLFQVKYTTYQKYQWVSRSDHQIWSKQLRSSFISFWNKSFKNVKSVQKWTEKRNIIASGDTHPEQPKTCIFQYLKWIVYNFVQYGFSEYEKCLKIFLNLPLISYYSNFENEW